MISSILSCVTRLAQLESKMIRMGLTMDELEEYRNLLLEGE